MEWFSNLSKGPKIALIVVSAVIALAIIGSFLPDEDAGSEAAPETTPSATPTPEASETPEADPEPEVNKAPEPEQDDPLADRVLASMELALGGDINSRCDYNEMRWHCFFDHYETGPIDGRVDIHLSFPGDVSKAQAKKYAEQARLHTFNLAGYDNEDLTEVVSFNQGVDSGTTFRRDVPLLN